MNVFVYRAEDHEGRMLADVIRRFDTEGQFRYLPVDSPATLRRAEWFLARHHGGAAPSPPLPMLVVASDLSGQRPQAHRVVRGAQLEEWFASLGDAVVRQGARAVETLREAVTANLAPHTVGIIAAGLAAPRPGREEGPWRPPAGASNVGDDPVPPPPAAANGGAAAAPPPPPPAAAARALARPVPGQRQPPAAAAAVAADTEAVDAWVEATVPERRKDKTVNLTEVMNNAKAREGGNAARNR